MLIRVESFPVPHGESPDLQTRSRGRGEGGGNGAQELPPILDFVTSSESNFGSFGGCYFCLTDMRHYLEEI